MADIDSQWEFSTWYSRASVFVQLDDAGGKDDGDLSSFSSDHPAPAPAPAPVPVPVQSYPSLTVDDVPRRPRTKHTKRLSTQPTAFPFSSPKVPVLPRSKPVSFRK